MATLLTESETALAIKVCANEFVNYQSHASAALQQAENIRSIIEGALVKAKEELIARGEVTDKK